MDNMKIKTILEFVKKEKLQTHLFLLDILEADDKMFEIIKYMTSLKEKDRNWINEVISQQVEDVTLKNRKKIREELKDVSN